MHKIDDKKPVLGGSGDKTLLESVSISLIPQKKGKLFINKDKSCP